MGIWYVCMKRGKNFRDKKTHNNDSNEKVKKIFESVYAPPSHGEEIFAEPSKKSIARFLIYVRGRKKFFLK